VILLTTPIIDGLKITEYCGTVAGEAINGANFVRDFFARIRDVIGGRVGSYESVLKDTRAQALRVLEKQAIALGADAVIGLQVAVQIYDGTIIVHAIGTAVKVSEEAS
jgi:uncharacterized protein YbjQ (UPF0145 family)